MYNFAVCVRYESRNIEKGNSSKSNLNSDGSAPVWQLEIQEEKKHECVNCWQKSAQSLLPEKNYVCEAKYNTFEINHTKMNNLSLTLKLFQTCMNFFFLLKTKLF